MTVGNWCCPGGGLSPLHTGAAKAEGPSLLSDQQLGSPMGFLKNFPKVNLSLLVLLSAISHLGITWLIPSGTSSAILPQSYLVISDSGRSHLPTVSLDTSQFGWFPILLHQFPCSSTVHFIPVPNILTPHFAYLSLAELRSPCHTNKKHTRWCASGHLVIYKLPFSSHYLFSAWKRGRKRLLKLAGSPDHVSFSWQLCGCDGDGRWGQHRVGANSSGAFLCPFSEYTLEKIM